MQDRKDDPTAVDPNRRGALRTGAVTAAGCSLQARRADRRRPPRPRDR